MHFELTLLLKGGLVCISLDDATTLKLQGENDAHVPHFFYYFRSKSCVAAGICSSSILHGNHKSCENHADAV